MNFLPTASQVAETVAPFPKPSKMYTIDWDHAPNATSNWGSTIAPGVTASTTTEQVLYTAPSTIKYAEFPLRMKFDSEIENSGAYPDT